MIGYMAEMVLEGRPVLFFGGGQVALRKLTGLLPCGPCITVVAPELHPQVAKMADAGQCSYRATVFSASLLDDLPVPVLVFAATGAAELNKEIARQCGQRGILCNSADDPKSSSFRVPAVLRRGPVTLAIATNGCSPALSRLLKERLDAWLDPGWGSLAELFGSMRTLVKKTFPDSLVRQTFWRDTCLAVARERRFEKTSNVRWFEERISQANKKIQSGSGDVMDHK